MTMNFSNLSRSFEDKHNRIRFWGHDSALEITFFLEVGALVKINPETNSAEAGLLEAFDVSLERIHQAARKVYERDQNQSYVFVISAEDFE